MTDRKESTDDTFKNPIFTDRSEESEGKGFIMSPKPIRCPRCGSVRFRKILYGMPAGPPDPEIYHVGGCSPRDEQWHCADCHHEW